MDGFTLVRAGGLAELIRRITSTTRTNHFESLGGAHQSPVCAPKVTGMSMLKNLIAPRIYPAHHESQAIIPNQDNLFIFKKSYFILSQPCSSELSNCQWINRQLWTPRFTFWGESMLKFTQCILFAGISPSFQVLSAASVFPSLVFPLNEQHMAWNWTLGNLPSVFQGGIPQGIYLTVLCTWGLVVLP